VTADNPSAPGGQPATREAGGSADGARRPRPGQKTPWAMVALVAFLWGLSLLIFDMLRVRVFEPRALSHLVMVAPAFAASGLAAIIALRLKRRGFPTLGGPAVHQFAIASGLMAFVALALALWLGPRILVLQEDAKVLAARDQLEDIAAALDRFLEQRGEYPQGAGAHALEVLVPGFADELHVTDPWGHELEYRSLSGGRGYLLLSRGRDGEQDVPLSDYVETPKLALAGNDILVINGWVIGAGVAGMDDSPRPWHRGAAPPREASPGEDGGGLSGAPPDEPPRGGT
jgi:hypothetical protein